MFGVRMALSASQLVASGIIQNLRLVEQLIQAGANVRLPKVTDGLTSFSSLVDTFA